MRSSTKLMEGAISLHGATKKRGRVGAQRSVSDCVAAGAPETLLALK
jgi:hypothetical protein